MVRDGHVIAELGMLFAALLSCRFVAAMEAPLQCHLNCHGKGATPAPLGAARSLLIKGLQLSACRESCFQTPGCEAVVFYSDGDPGNPTQCVGKKDVRTRKCKKDANYVTELIDPPWGRCSLLERSRIDTFDGAFETLAAAGHADVASPSSGALDSLLPGEYFLVKSSQFHAQGRFGYTQLYRNASSIIGLALGGTLMGGHRLVILHVGDQTQTYQRGFKAYWDDVEILQGYPSKFHDDIISASFAPMNRSTTDEGKLALHEKNVNLPAYAIVLEPYILIYALVAVDSLKVMLRMKKIMDGMDGYCGNFNCNPDDDTQAALLGRAGPTIVPIHENLFRFAPPAASYHQVFGLPLPSLANCGAFREIAEERCSAVGDQAAIDQCIQAVCASQNTEPLSGSASSQMQSSGASLKPVSKAPSASIGTSPGPDHTPTNRSGANHTGSMTSGASETSQAGVKRWRTNQAGVSHADSADWGYRQSETSGTGWITSSTPAPGKSRHTSPGQTASRRSGSLTPFSFPTMSCNLNCFGASAVPLAMLGSSLVDSFAVLGVRLDKCRRLCVETEGCQGIVYGKNTCYGKRSIYTSKCQPGDGVYHTEILSALPKGVCGLFGDPHAITFDNPYGATVNQYRQGVFYAVQSEDIQIQSRFGFCGQYPDASVTLGIAVSGRLIRNHTLVVQNMGKGRGVAAFSAFWDGRRILERFPSTFESEDHVLHARHENIDPDSQHEKARHTIGGTSGALPSYEFKFLPDWKIYILIGDELMNVVIEMQKQAGGQSGYCGNFNCDPTDDTIDMLAATSPIPETQSLFAGAPKPQRNKFAGRTPSGAPGQECNSVLRAQAEAACMRMSDDSQREACIFDACVAGNVKAAKTDVALSSMSHSAEVDAGEISLKFASGLLFFGGAKLSWQWLAGVLMLASCALLTSLLLGRSSRWSGKGHARYAQVSVIEESKEKSHTAPNVASRLMETLRLIAGAALSDVHVVPQEHSRIFVLESHGLSRAWRSHFGDSGSEEEDKLLA